MPEGFVHVPFGDLDALVAAIAAHDPAAVLLECIQAEGGIITPPEGYLPAVQAACRAAGALFMVDEVQTGLGRTGRWFAFEEEGLQPDVVTMAKALGNGVPVGACWAAEEVAAAFQPGDHGSTVGGQPLAMAAARATLEALIELDAPRASEEAGRQLIAGLLDLPGVVAVRGRGLLLGIQLEQAQASSVTAAALHHGLVVNAVRPDTVRMAPPLNVSSEEIAMALVRFGAALEDAQVAS
jgi:acetylornithine/succinyldiaminopimelate/putrescine aminotransferase